MSQNSSKKAEDSEIVTEKKLRFKWWMLIVLPAWVVVSFYLVQLVIGLLIIGVRSLGLSVEISDNETVINSIFAVIIYTLTIVVVVGVPYLVRGVRVSREQLGIKKWPAWTDIFLAPIGLVVYLLMSAALIIIVSTILPAINLNEVQDTGFNHISMNYEYILAFITLVIIAPIAEELLFRGYLYGQLKRFVPVWVAILATSLLFGIIHGSWNVGLDTFALSIVLCSLREISGTIYPSILLHMLKNGIAFYLLFINPFFLTTLGG